MCRVTMGHLRVTIGHPRVTIGHFRNCLPSKLFVDAFSKYCMKTLLYIDIKGGLTTRFDLPPNALRELKLHRSSTNVCTKTKMFLKIFFDIRFRSEGT